MANIDDLKHDPINARRHNPRNTGMIKTSIAEQGFGRSILLANDGTIIAGNATVDAAADVGLTDVQIVESDGTKVIAVKRTDVEPGSDAFFHLGLSDNRAAELASWDPMMLADVATRIDTRNHFTDAELETLRGLGDAEQAQAINEGKMIKGTKPNPRKLAIDAIYTLRPIDASCFVAADAGFQIGTRSDNDTLREDQRHKWEWKFSLTFLDNPYHDYDHGAHAEVVERLRPKYATVRDVMTKRQCADAGIPFYSFDQIMQWAESLEQFVERVIVIPKYDCLDAIPERFNIGYSVPTSYGGTPVPAETFRGRRIHLLGGSWKTQLGYLSLLRDDVVSFDFNHINHIAQWGGYVYPDGSREAGRLIQDLGLSVTNARQTCLAISLGHIGRAIHDLFGLEQFAPEPLSDEITEEGSLHEQA